MTKRDSIAKEIRDLGAGYRQILRDSLVHYLLQKDAAGRVGQGARPVETAMKDKIVVEDETQLLQQEAGRTGRLQYAQGKGCHHHDVPLIHVKAFGN